jgi:nicotinamidase-related amidase
MATTALIVVDVQQGFEDPGNPPRDNPSAEANVERLIAAWRSRGEPVVFVRHASGEADSPLAPGQRGHEFKAVVTGEPDLLVTKSVHSAFYGEPDLHAWLQGAGLQAIAICGIQTNYCCETTARMGGDLGYDVTFVADAMHTFDMTGPDGATIPAAEISRATQASLHGEFATVRTTDAVVAG